MSSRIKTSPTAIQAQRVLELVAISFAMLHRSSDAVDCFTSDELPPLSLTRVTPAQIARLFEHFFHPEWPTQFD